MTTTALMMMITVMMIITASLMFCCTRTFENHPDSHPLRTSSCWLCLSRLWCDWCAAAALTNTTCMKGLRRFLSCRSEWWESNLKLQGANDSRRDRPLNTSLSANIVECGSTLAFPAKAQQSMSTCRVKQRQSWPTLSVCASFDEAEALQLWRWTPWRWRVPDNVRDSSVEMRKDSSKNLLWKMIHWQHNIQSLNYSGLAANPEK